jgi:tetratricopeptide (TPR) repeat protein
MSRLADLEANLSLLHEKLAHLEHAEIITANASEGFELKRKIEEIRRKIAEVEAEKSGLSGEAKTGASAGAPGTQSAAVNGPAGQVVIVQNLYGNLTTSGAAERQASPMAGGKFINVPGRNDFFTGREEILSRLHATLKAEGRAAIKQAISGLGGIGKTQTAIEYAHRHAEDYACVLWTGAESESALTSGFASFAPHLGLPSLEKTEETVAAVKRLLTQRSDWLLILDNADALERVDKFLPNPVTGAVLLTSRATNFRRVGIANPVTLEVMTEAEALAFFAKALGVDAIAAEESEAAKNLAKELGHLPLALEQVAAYVKKNRVSFGKYLELYRARRLAILKKSQPEVGDYQADAETGRRHTVETTWRLNFEQVETASPAAADILRVSAFCAPDPIPFEVVAKGDEEISEAVAMAVAEADVVNEVIRPLTEYSLVAMDGERETFAVHRLVQAVTRERLGVEEPEWAERAVRAVNRAFSDEENFYQGDACERLVPHAKELAHAIEAFRLETAEAAWLLNNCGYFLRERTRYAEAKPLLERALTIQEKTLGAEHRDTATILNNLAGLYDDQGEYGKALPLSERALAIREKALGAEHPSTAVSLNNLAGLYEAQGEYGKALPMYERALAIREKALGTEHPDTATSLNNLAGLYEAQGEYGKALPLYERALAIREKTLGAKRRETATSLNNLATLYQAQGEYGKAAPLYERALAIREKALGAEHPDTATSLNNLAYLYYAQGEYGKAEPLFERALAMTEKMLGTEHPLTAGSLNNLAELYRVRGAYAKAESLMKCALAINEKALGVEHPDTAGSLNNLAGLYDMQGAYANAVPLYERALAIWEKALGAEHPSTARGLNNMASLYAAQGDSAKALPLYERALAIREKALGAEHPDTARGLNNLALLYKEQGDYGKAEPLYERALAIYEKALGAEHPDTAQSLSNLAELYRAQGEYGKALPLSERVLAILEKALGAEHPSTATSLNNLALLYSEQGDYGKALPLLERAVAIFEKTLGAEHPHTQNAAFGLAAVRGMMSPPA